MLPTARARVARAIFVVTLHASPLLVPQAGAQDCKKTGLDAPTYARVLSERFSALLSPQSNAILGTFASLDIKDADATFAGTSVLSSSRVVGVEVHGGVDEGVLGIINNQELNSKFGAKVQLHFLANGPTMLEYTHTSCEAYYAALQKAQDDYAVKVTEIDGGFAEIRRKLEIVGLTKKITQLDSAIGVAAAAKDLLNADSLRVERAKADELRTQAEQRGLSAEDQVTARKAARVALGNQRAAALADAAKLLQVTGLSVGWWSVGYDIENTGFRLFDPAAQFESQVTRKSYASQSVGLIYSRYALTRAGDRTRFWSVGAYGSRENNLGDLTKVELTDSKPFGPNPDDRVSTKKYTGYQGTYEKNLKTLRLTGDYYRFFSNNQLALHIYPAIEVKDKLRPAYASGIGVLMTARNAKDEKSVLNAELYWNLTDLSDSRDSDKDLIGRSGLGLRFSFPITFSPKV